MHFCKIPGKDLTSICAQAAFEMIAARFPGAFEGYKLEVVEAHQSSKARRKKSSCKRSPFYRWTRPALLKLWSRHSNAWAVNLMLLISCVFAMKRVNEQWEFQAREFWC